MFATPLDHLHAELHRLDLLLHREILRLRATYQLSLDEFRGLYVSDAQGDELVTQATGGKGSSNVASDVTQQAENLRQDNLVRLSPTLPWSRLVSMFRLSQEEQDVLLLALAPEIDLKYETLYAYLNNDVTRKWPTCELALRILAPARDEMMQYRRCLQPDSILVKEGLIRLIPPSGDRPRWLASGLAVPRVVVNFLLGDRAIDPELEKVVELRSSVQEWNRVPISESMRIGLRRCAQYLKEDPQRSGQPLLVFEGREGVGRGVAAEALAHDLGCPLVVVDCEAIRVAADSLAKLAPSIRLHQRLYDGVLYLDYAQSLFDHEGRPLAEAGRFMKILTKSGRPSVLSCLPGTRWRDLVRGRRVIPLVFEDLSSTERVEQWQAAATESEVPAGSDTLAALGHRFVLTPGQIRAAVETVQDLTQLSSALENERGSELVWFQAARAQSDTQLRQLAQQVRTSHTWEHVVLPETVINRLKHITSAIRYRHLVYEDWGFEERLASGKGLLVLFAGPSGTGKTMTAGVMARDLGLDLYKIDLSSIVSKYIGETEKNLERIFRAAQCSNAILFFDEADALFGKRSEVKDAHDRYANIEVSYLLQKIEDHDGPVILATNLTKNIDDAFARRMHFVVRFPLPDEEQRQRLWRGMVPKQAPLDQAVDFPFLAAQFSFAGGDIRNIVLDAAFRAAEDGKVITMPHLLRAIEQQFIKQGRVPCAAEFRQYYDLLTKEN